MKSFLRSFFLFALIGAVGALGWRMIQRSMTPAQIPRADAAIATQAAGPSPAVKAEEIASSANEPAGVLSGRVSKPEAKDALLAQIEVALNSREEADWNHALNELFPALIVQDRQAAARVAENFPVGEKREQLLRRLARAWAAVDFAGAVGWIGNLSPVEEQKAALEDACFGAAETTPAEAVNVWEKLGFTADDQVMSNLMQNWAMKDLDGARAWATARPASLQRDQAVARVAYMMAQSKPADAAAFAATEIPPGPAQTEAVISVLHRWAQYDLAGAIAWAAGFPEGALRDRAVGELAGLARGQN